MAIQTALKSNIWKYAVFLIANKRVFSAILGAYYISIPNVGAREVGIILLAGSVAGFLLEIPSGYISDKIGHKQALVFSRVCAALSTVFFLFANDLNYLILGGVFLSFANAFLSGTGAAFMHETLRGLKREDDYAEVMGKIRSIGFAIPAVIAMAVPFLVVYSFKLPFLVGLIFDVVGLLIAASFIAPNVTQEHIDEVNATNFIDVVKEGKRLQFIRIVLFAGILSGLITIAGRYRGVYWSVLEVPVIYYGVFLGIGRIFISLLLLTSGKLKKILSYYNYLAIRSIVFFILIASMGFITVPWMVVVIFVVINIFSFGFGTLNNSYMLDIVGKSKFKATLISMRAQTNVLVIGIGSYLFGLSADKLGYENSFLILAVTLLVVLLPLYLYVIRRRA